MAKRIVMAAALLSLGVGLSQGAAAQGFFNTLKDTLGGSGGGSDQPSDSGGSAAASPPAPSAVPAGQCGGDGQLSLLNAAVEQGLGVVRDEQLSAYLQGVVGKLLAVSPNPNCRVTVFVTPHDAAQAVALKDGGILVALGFLRNLKNEDEVAALLGHEVSHILRNHHSSDAVVELQDGFLKGLEAANASGGMLLGMVDPNLQRTVDASLSIGDALYSVSESMIAPAWTIEQEDEADLMGVDLMVAAGYNPRAMASVMEVIEAQEANAAAVDAERDKLYNERVKGTLVNSMLSSSTGDTVSIVGALANLTSTIVSGTDKKTHRPAAERKASVDAYIRDNHGGARRRAFTTDPWQARLNSGDSGQMFAQYKAATDARRAVFSGGDINAALNNAEVAVAGRFSGDAYPRLAFSEVRVKEGNRDKALENLDIAMKGGSAPWQVYRSYADMQLAKGDTAGAAATVETADAKFGRPLGLAPYAIEVHRAAGDQNKVAYYMER
jgi:Zn-dependent protease with chaperone function